jgi:hypothetical protein
MSQPPSSLPRDVFELLVTTCGWEKFEGFDGHAEPSYAALVTKTCYRESHSMLQTGLEAKRVAEITASDPDYDLYFDADDADVRGFSLWDRFTPYGVGTTDADNPDSLALQATSIATVLGPWGSTPWLVAVAF